LARRGVIGLLVLALALCVAAPAAAKKKVTKYRAAYSGEYHRTIDESEGFSQQTDANWDLKSKGVAFKIERLSNGDYFVDGDLDARSMDGSANRTETFVDPAEGNSTSEVDNPSFLDATLRRDPAGKRRQLAATGLDYSTYGDDMGSDDPVRYWMEIGAGKPKKRYELPIQASQQDSDGSVTVTTSLSAVWTLKRVK
jgi:hypothetical protein